MLQMSVKRGYGGAVVNAMSSAPASVLLRRWLSGRWALLFSHPEDFAHHGFEADRWLMCLRDAFENLELKAVAVGDGDDGSWISKIGGRFIAKNDADDFMPSQWSARERFVTIFDGSVRARRTLLYWGGSQAPSAIELAQTAAHLRAQSASSVRRVLQSV